MRQAADRQGAHRILRTWALVGLCITASAIADAQQGAPAAAAGAPQPSVRELEAAVKREPGNASRLVSLGLAYWDRNEYPRALNAFQRAVKVDPRSPEAHNWLGVALSEKADLPGGIASFKKAIALDPKYGRAYTNLGAALARSGDFAAARTVFQQALTLEPNSLAARMNLGRTLRETGNLDEALDQLRRVVAGDPGNAGAHYELGQTLRQRGDLAAAVAAFEQALAIEPELREGYYALGSALKEQAAAARRSPSGAQMAVAATTSPAAEVYARGQEAAARGDLAEARDRLQEALRRDPAHVESLTLLVFVLGQLRNLPSALATASRAVSLRPDSAEAHYNFGVALAYSGVQARAIEELRKSVQLEPASGAYAAFLGTTLRDSTDPPPDLAGARMFLQRAIALMPPTTAVYVDLGIALLRAGAIDQAFGQFEAGLNLPSPSVPAPAWDVAAADLRRAMAAVPARAEAHDMLGLLLGRQGADSREVAAAFREAIRLRPEFAEAHNHLGLVLLQAQDEEAGIAALRTAVRLAPDYAEAHANLGAALTPTDAAAAIRELERAVALAPNAVGAQFNLAMAYGASPRAGAAKQIEQLRKVIVLAPAFARAHVALGKALLQNGDVPPAIEALQEAARLEPRNGEAHYQLGLALARAGRQDEATAALQKGRDLNAADDRAQNVALDIAEARAALEKGDAAQAEARLRHALQLDPESAEAKRALSDLARRADAAKPVDDPARVAEFEGYIREAKFAEVEPLLAAYVKARPESAWGWYALGYSQFAQQKVGPAIQSLSKSLGYDVRNAEAHKILGRTLMLIGRFDVAQREFEHGLRYKPDSAELHYNLGKLFSIQDNWEPARKAFEAALRIDPAYLEALDALGFAREALGDDPGAIACYEKVVALNAAQQGRFAGSHVSLSAYYNRTGDAAKALAYARQAIELDPKSDRAWFQRAKADEREGRLAEAVGALNSAIALNPRASSYYYVLAGLYRRLGDLEESRKALEQFTRLEKESSELEKMRRSGASRD